MNVIEVKHLTKEYQLGALTTIKDSLLNTLKRLQGKPVTERKLFKALEDINFTIEKGEVVGIIGTNGAGKSTLLKHLARITTPTSGEVIVSGSVAPLIEVGAGFVKELTGRENIYLNCSIMGMTRKDIDAKIDSIIEFAELEEFIDTPVKRYSSGMTVRLGFSIATSIDADILIVDEVLAVGDLAFQRKCFDRMEDIIRNKGKTVLLVSHNIRQVDRICSRVIHLKEGRVVLDADASEGCESFYRESNDKITQDAEKGGHSNIQSTGELELIDVKILNNEGNEISEIDSGGPLTARVRFKLLKPFEFLELYVGTHRSDFLYLSVANSKDYLSKDSYEAGEYEIEYCLPSFPLSPGVYSIRFAALTNTGRFVFNGESLKTFFIRAEPGRLMNPAWNILDLKADMRLIG
ncbi:MAG: ABC transporter ATP-binding protein [Gammaproteobacteria bacterium]|nr:ABC transporter ATP-binding protein [Pseudomonadales bacterium]